MTAAPVRIAPGAAAPFERPRHYLQPGQLVAFAEPTEVVTILGSCVAVCLWDSHARVGGVNHFLLPFPATGTVASPRFGNVAMFELLAAVEALGARRYALRASVVGGAAMFNQWSGPQHLGERNVEVACALLRRWAIEAVFVDVGGDRGRKLRFNTDEGRVCSTSI